MHDLVKLFRVKFRTEKQASVLPELCRVKTSLTAPELCEPPEGATESAILSFKFVQYNNYISVANVKVKK